MKTPEDLLRENVRALISLVKKKNKKFVSDEDRLRSMIREFVQYELKEVATADVDPSPHESTGINVLEDFLKDNIKTVELDFKQLKSSQEQRDSYRAHLIQAIRDTLSPVELNNAANQQGPAGAVDEEVDISIEDDEPTSKEDMFINVLDDEEEVEEDPREKFGIKGQDVTGGNMAYKTFKSIGPSLVDSYDMLADPKDQDLFVRYIDANINLYLDKFQNEMNPNLQTPESPEYKAAKGEQAAGAVNESTEIIDLEF